MRLLAFFPIALLLAACACESTQRASITGYRPAAVDPCAPRAAAPCDPCASAEAPMAGTFSVQPPTGIEFRVGAAEQARAALAIPPNVAACFVQGGYEILMAAVKAINCAVGQLVPTPVPTQRFVWDQPAAAAPCAPAGTWQFVPAAPPAAVPCK